MGVVDLLGADHVGEFDGLAHLPTDPRSSGGRGLAQPSVGTVAQGREGRLLGAARPDRRLQDRAAERVPHAAGRR